MNQEKKIKPKKTKTILAHKCKYSWSQVMVMFAICYEKVFTKFAPQNRLISLSYPYLKEYKDTYKSGVQAYAVYIGMYEDRLPSEL